jgi:hypothetical protein
MAIAEQDTASSDAALARKHRIAMRNRQRSTSTVSTSSSEGETTETPTEGRNCNNKRPRVALESEPMIVSSSDATTKSSPEDIMESIKKKKPHITGIKKQSRYDPGVSMTKAELKAWRKEARRVRNRESAAASRKKNRESIDMFEAEVKVVQTKYDAALQYILDLEDKLKRSRSSSSSFYPSDVLRQDLEGIKKVSPQGFEATRQTISPPQSPTPSELPQEVVTPTQARRQWPVQVRNDLDNNTPYHPFAVYHPNHPSTLNSQKHIIDNTIIRPIACV